ncbi:glycosyltransferase family 2 protein [Treponema bryantii]|uniref:glycosyltransferase family 2 protein n=1 Tax=Treponema bryantii TaxID=163 RepID=UPI0003B3FD27|nr:glycosyltransferase family 2 protein [Treponema bryantii]
MKFGFVIPVYRHGSTLQTVVNSIAAFGFPIIVVDDGNDEENRSFISEVAEKNPLVTLVTREKNGGKGLAMVSGVKKAHEMGLTHILQLDSDGQHDAEKAARFFEVSKHNPDAIICGYPEYDASAPKKRVKGRKVANGWIHLVTLSQDIKDAMIGFRIYPVEDFLNVYKHSLYIDARMGFDIEVLVRMYWRGVPVISEPVKVFYPADGISNYNYFTDTVRISWVYTRLCLELILRAPVLIFRKIKRSIGARGK